MIRLPYHEKQKIICRTKNVSATWWGRGILCSQPCSGCPGCCNPGFECYLNIYLFIFSNIICSGCPGCCNPGVKCYFQRFNDMFSLLEKKSSQILNSNFREYCPLLWKKTHKKRKTKATWTHLSIENTHRLGKVMSLHNASLAAVQSRQHRVGRDL